MCPFPTADTLAAKRGGVDASIVGGLVCLQGCLLVYLFAHCMLSMFVGTSWCAGLCACALNQLQPVPCACVQIVARSLQSGSSPVLRAACFPRVSRPARPATAGVLLRSARSVRSDMFEHELCANPQFACSSLSIRKEHASSSRHPPSAQNWWGGR